MRGLRIIIDTIGGASGSCRIFVPWVPNQGEHLDYAFFWGLGWEELKEGGTGTHADHAGMTYGRSRGDNVYHGIMYCIKRY